ncbi:MAG: hypothetical protein PVH78_01040, partial [Deltaproteobacteria bacterium]
RLQKGDNILDVSRQLGHHSVRVTEASYYDYMPGTHRNQVDELDLEAAPDCTYMHPRPNLKIATN